MTYTYFAFKFDQVIFFKNLRHKAHTLDGIGFLTVVNGYSRGFLPAMLQCIQAIVHLKRGGHGMAFITVFHHTHNTTFFTHFDPGRVKEKRQLVFALCLPLVTSHAGCLPESAGSTLFCMNIK
jgi:thiamine biosynthesis protein ThiC